MMKAFQVLYKNLRICRVREASGTNQIAKKRSIIPRQNSHKKVIVTKDGGRLQIQRSRSFRMDRWLTSIWTIWNKCNIIIWWNCIVGGWRFYGDWFILHNPALRTSGICFRHYDHNEVSVSLRPWYGSYFSHTREHWPFCLFVGKRRISLYFCPAEWDAWQFTQRARDDERSLDDLEILLVGLETEQKQELLASVLASKVSRMKMKYRRECVAWRLKKLCFFHDWVFVLPKACE